MSAKVLFARLPELVGQVRKHDDVCMARQALQRFCSSLDGFKPCCLFLEEGHQCRPDLGPRQGFVIAFAPDVSIEGEAGRIEPQAIAVEPAFKPAQEVNHHLIDIAQQQRPGRVEVETCDLRPGGGLHYGVHRHYRAPMLAGRCSADRA